MAIQTQLTEKELEEMTGVSGITFAKWTRGIFLVTGSVFRFGNFVLPAASKSALTSTGLSATASASTLFLGSMILGVGGAVFNAFVSLGLPVAEAKELVKERNAKGGFALGLALGVLNCPVFKVKSRYLIKGTKGGFQPYYMKGIGENAFNLALVTGYAAAIKGTDSEKAELNRALVNVLIKGAKSSGNELNMSNWTDDDWYHAYARAVAKLKN